MEIPIYTMIYHDIPPTNPGFFQQPPPQVTGLAYAHDGLVLLTNDGIFAETLSSADGWMKPWDPSNLSDEF